MGKLSLLFVLPLLLLLSGCSGKLSDADAEKIIKGKIQFPLTNSIDLEYGLVANGTDSLPDYYYILQKKGMFIIEHLGEGGFLTRSYRFRVMLTPEAKKFLIKENNPPLKQGDSGEFMYDSKFRTSETQFGKINSIHEIPSMNAADIHYVVKLTSITPFWSYYLSKSKSAPDTIDDRIFTVIKTNEGWAPAK